MHNHFEAKKAKLASEIEALGVAALRSEADTLAAAIHAETGGKNGATSVTVEGLRFRLERAKTRLSFAECEANSLHNQAQAIEAASKADALITACTADTKKALAALKAATADHAKAIETAAKLKAETERERNAHTAALADSGAAALKAIKAGFELSSVHTTSRAMLDTAEAALELAEAEAEDAGAVLAAAEDDLRGCEQATLEAQAIKTHRDLMMAQPAYVAALAAHIVAHRNAHRETFYPDDVNQEAQTTARRTWSQE